MKIPKIINFLIMLSFWSVSIPVKAQGSISAQPSITKLLQEQANGYAEIEYHAETGLASWISFDTKSQLNAKASNSNIQSPAEASMLYMNVYGSLFGLSDPPQELKVQDTQLADDGRNFVRYQQEYHGIPILGAEIIVQTGASQELLSANGAALPAADIGVSIDITPTISAEKAQERAREAISQEYSLSPADLAVAQPVLWIYNPQVLNWPGPRVSRLVWKMEITCPKLLTVRELVLVDAHLGTVVLHFNQLDTILYRKIYDNQNNKTAGLPGIGPVLSEGQQTGGASIDAQHAYIFAKITYDFYRNVLGRDSLDGNGMQLISTVRYCPSSADPRYCPYSNAFWNGSQMVYGQGYASADDVVGHEMTHGVTEHGSQLFYYMQSGAINESLSDIFGELIDLSDGLGNDSPSVRWLLGEDMPVGAIRSMSNPIAYQNPDSMNSSIYNCDVNEKDNGGVHTNSGVGNKAAYLMVDGGSFNGITVAGLGIQKVAKIYYEAQTHLLTSGGDYQDLYNDLQQACKNLNGTATSAADCDQVKKALDAVKMNQQPANCAAPEAPVCPTGQLANDMYFDNLENPAAGKWVSGALSGVNGWAYPQPPDYTYTTSGKYSLWGYDQSTPSDSYIQMSSGISIPAGSQAYLRFNHAYNFDNTSNIYHDGGVVEYSTDTGTTWTDAGTLFTDNGYNNKIASGNSNPLQGRPAFVYKTSGYISSRLDLRSLGGKSVRFRFRMGTDKSVDDYGWFIDDVHVYTCGSQSRLITDLLIRHIGTFSPTGDATVVEGLPGANFGNTSDMAAGYDAGPYSTTQAKTMRSLLMFNVSSIPKGAKVASARLYVYMFGSQDNPQTIHPIYAYNITGNWAESGVTWANQPGFGSLAATTDMHANITGWYSFDLTRLVQAWIDGSTVNHGVMLRGNESITDPYIRKFYAKSGTYPPRLVVTYSPGKVSLGIPTAVETKWTGSVEPGIFQIIPGLIP